MGDRSWLKDAAVVLGASVIIALFAHLSIPLPFTPVPISTQSHVVLLLACLLGSKKGSLAVLTFIAQGAIGFPVFGGGASGIMNLAGPRGGYLLGWVVAAYAVGFIMERLSNRTPYRVFAAMGLGNLVIYLFGLPWLSRFVGWQNAFVMGMLPFLIGDMLKLVIVTRSLKGLRFFN